MTTLGLSIRDRLALEVLRNAGVTLLVGAAGLYSRVSSRADVLYDRHAVLTTTTIRSVTVRAVLTVAVVLLLAIAVRLVDGAW